jgi:hypothetical protein
MTNMSIDELNSALRNGPYAWPGGYPIYFIMADGEAISFKSAEEHADLMRAAINGEYGCWLPAVADINWEDADLYCAHSGERIESAYSE